MHNDNPYAPPMTPIAEPFLAQTALPIPASQWKRFLNMIIDQVVTTGLSSVTGGVLGFVFALSRANPGLPPTKDELASLQIMSFVLGILLVLAYYIISEGLFQRTLGKLLTGTRVVTADGGRPTFGQIVGRSFARLIPFEAFSFLGGGGSGPVGWHDSLSGTRVVQVR